ncbi:DUF6350 family protein [Streptomyces sp. NPDC091272]|uniref:cell division protein PerM n=1 Tax=Streptomyces sp. NPDC091272 TaxID=3365981 RepID=UPI00380E9965
MNPNPVTDHPHEPEGESEVEYEAVYEGGAGSAAGAAGVLGATGAQVGPGAAEGVGAAGPVESVESEGAAGAVGAMGAVGARNRPSGLAVCLVRGGLAAGLGLAASAVLVMVLWISSPYPDAGAGAALRVAAGLWLLAHGADLVRSDTLSGVAAPVGLTPMLCAVLPLWLAHRAARDAVEDGGDEDGAEPRTPPSGRAAFGGVTLGYLAVAGAATLYAAGGPLPATPWSVALYLPVVVALAAGAGVWTAYGRPHGPLPGWVPEGVRREFVRPRLTTAARAAAAGTAVLLGGGALAVGASLVWHADLAQESFLQLAGEWSGRLAVLLLALALVPNSAVWAASYGIGTGFAVGTDALVTPLTGAGPAVLPHFPLLAAMPGQGRGTALNWAVVAVPLLAGLTVAWFTVRVAAPAYVVREEAWGRRRTAGTAALAALGCAVATALLAAASGGPLGTERLAEFGPVWWRAGLGALAWLLGVGVPGALLLRGWRVRERSPIWWVRGWRDEEGEEVVRERATRGGGARGVGARGGAARGGAVRDGAGSGVAQAAWHESGAREVRRAALREAAWGAPTVGSGGSSQSQSQSPARPVPYAAESSPLPQLPGASSGLSQPAAVGVLPGGADGPPAVIVPPVRGVLPDGDAELGEGDGGEER